MNKVTGKTLDICEIFWSFQGEGLRAGVPSIFIRLAGCSLRCPYCDQTDAWESGTARLVSDILAEVDGYRRQYPGSQVVITGGEPLEQDINELVRQLKERDFFISIETNGIHFQELPIDWWTVSPKDISQFRLNDHLSGMINEVKLIAFPDLTVETIKRIRRKLERMSTSPVPIILQPGTSQHNPVHYKDVFTLFRRCIETGIANIRAGIQLHKIYKVQ